MYPIPLLLTKSVSTVENSVIVIWQKARLSARKTTGCRTNRTYWTRMNSFIIIIIIFLWQKKNEKTFLGDESSYYYENSGGGKKTHRGVAETRIIRARGNVLCRGRGERVSRSNVFRVKCGCQKIGRRQRSVSRTEETVVPEASRETRVHANITRVPLPGNLPPPPAARPFDGYHFSDWKRLGFIHGRFFALSVRLARANFCSVFFFSHVYIYT